MKTQFPKYELGKKCPWRLGTYKTNAECAESSKPDGVCKWRAEDDMDCPYLESKTKGEK